MADIELVQWDTAPDIEGVIRDAEGVVDLTDATSVRYQLRREGSRDYMINAAASIIDASEGTVRYTIMPGDLSQWGDDFVGQWEVHWEDTTIQTTTPAHTVSVRRQ